MGDVSTSADEDLRDQIAAAAVGALPRDERAELARALARRPAFQRELEDLERVAACLAIGLVAEPPTRVWAEVAARLGDAPFRRR